VPMIRPIQIIVGGLYGSEAKGAIAAHLVQRDRIDIAVRTGATNAGHTVVYTDAAGVRHSVAMQQLPVGWVRPETRLVLGAGTLVDLDILRRECETVSALTGRDIRGRLMIDYRAFVHRREHKHRSTQSDRHHLIGATGKGCSEALVDRVRLRGIEDWTVGSVAAQEYGRELGLQNYDICDTERWMNAMWDQGAGIQLEGTQGQLLDLYLGPYPYTTHKQTGPAQWMLEAGFSPALPTEIWMVVRTYPIRVAGNSGPLPNETSWPTLARSINGKRERVGLAPIVAEDAIVAFEFAVRQATRVLPDCMKPAGSDGLDQHTWQDRLRYREALSEIHKSALVSLDDATVAELRKLFELTTVTKKLRRVAMPFAASLETAARQIRPSYVAVTFLNYEFPERWYCGAPLTVSEEMYLRDYMRLAPGGVGLVNRGPNPEHIIEVDPD
jgi:adenylosuccinate synthase